MLFLEYPPCSTCQKAKRFLDQKHIEYIDRNMKEENPTYQELKEWIQQSDLPIKTFFNTSGLVYKKLQLKDKLATMSEEEQIRLLATDGMLVKRPLLISKNRILVGFHEEQWESI